jgi:hypothetical protein
MADWPPVGAERKGSRHDRFLAADGDHDRLTDAVIRHIRSAGDAWLGGATWRGRRAMRISVCNWSTTDADIDRAVAAVRRSLATARD